MNWEVIHVRDISVVLVVGRKLIRVRLVLSKFLEMVRRVGEARI